MQQDTCKARQFICQKLGIAHIGSEVRLVLERPEYAVDARFDIELNDESDRYWRSIGITKSFLDRLHCCINTASGNHVRSEGYFASNDSYILYLGIDKIQQEFSDLSPQELFRQLDNLKTLGMLAEIIFLCSSKMALMLLFPTLVMVSSSRYISIPLLSCLKIEIASHCWMNQIRFCIQNGSLNS